MLKHTQIECIFALPPLSLSLSPFFQLTFFQQLISGLINLVLCITFVASILKFKTKLIIHMEWNFISHKFWVKFVGESEVECVLSSPQPWNIKPRISILHRKCQLEILSSSLRVNISSPSKRSTPWVLASITNTRRHSVTRVHTQGNVYRFKRRLYVTQGVSEVSFLPSYGRRKRPSVYVCHFSQNPLLHCIHKSEQEKRDEKTLRGWRTKILRNSKFCSRRQDILDQRSGFFF